MYTKRIAAALAVALVAGSLSPATALAGQRAAKRVGPGGRVPPAWDLPKPPSRPHPDTAPSSAGGSGDGANAITFSNFDDGDIVVVLGTATGHAGLFDEPRYVTINSSAILSANTTPRNGVQYETCVKYRGYDSAYGLWVPGYTWAGVSARNFCRAQLGEPYNIAASKSDDTAWYCSKLAWAGWRRRASVDLDADGGYWVWPVDLVNSGRTAAFGIWN